LLFSYQYHHMAMTDIASHPSMAIGYDHVILLYSYAFPSTYFSYLANQLPLIPNAV